MKTTNPAYRHHRLSHAAAALSAALLLFPAVFAQSVNPPPAGPATATAPVPVVTRAAEPAAPAVAEDEVVVLEEFNVSASTRTDEWVATQSLAGTRLPEDITNVPYQIQILTSEMLQDFGMVSVVDQLSAISGFVGEADQADPAIAASAGISGGGGRLRGFPLLVFRDGFRWSTPPQVSVLSQLEVIKGPISALYGAAQPGGIAQYSSRRPSAREEYRFGLLVGNYDRYEPEFLINMPIVPRKVFLLLNGGYASRKSDIQYVINNTKTLAGSILYKITPKTSITVSYETQTSDGIRQGGAPNYVVDARLRDGATLPYDWNTDSGYIGGIWWPWVENGYNLAGPNEYNKRTYDRWHVQFEQRINRYLSFKAVYQWQHKTFYQDYYNSSNVALDFIGIGTAADGRPYGGTTGFVPQVRTQDYKYPYAFLFDVVANFKTGKVGHSLLFTVDLSQQELDSQQWRLPSAAQSPQYGATVPEEIRFMDPRYPNWDLTWYQPPGGGDIFDNIGSRDRDLANASNTYTTTAAGTGMGDNPRSRLSSVHYTKLDLRGYSLVERAFLFDKRLILMGSLRLDQTDYGDYQITTSRNTFHQWEENGETLRVLSTARFEDGQPVAVQYWNGSAWAPKMITDAKGREAQLRIPAAFRPNWVPKAEEKLTWSFGANWKALSDDKLIFFANYSTSFNPQITVDNGTNELMPNETGKGFEGGIKLIPFGLKRILTVVSFFNTQKDNIAVSNPLYTGNVGDQTPQYSGVGNFRTRGVDIDLTWFATKRLTILSSACYLDSKILETSDQYTKGKRMTAVPSKTFTMRGKYTFAGMLKGFEIGADVSYNSGWVRGYYQPVRSAAAGRHYEWIGGKTLWGGYVKYRWKSGRKATHDINLGTRNMLDKLHTGLGATRSLGRQVFIRYVFTYK